MMTVSVLLTVLSGWGLTFLLERSLRPRPRLLGRPFGAHAVHLGTWLAVFGGLLLVVERPLLALALALLAWFAVVLVSNAKYNSLKEPLVATDLQFLSHIVHHPRLYVPFLGVSRIILFGGALGVAAAGAWYLERLWPPPADWPGFLPIAAAFGTPAGVLVWAGTRQCGAPTLDPAVDLRRWGLVASLWAYWVAERRRILETPRSPFEQARASRAVTARPDIVVVQSESFFDARRLFSGVRADVLEHFDALRLASVAEGRLRVPAWGANTVRTEFSFLSGLASESLGVDRLNPYRALARLPVPTIASYLRGLGYRTICVHPYPSTFYGRDRVFPVLGFDEFVDVRAFADAQTFGPHVSDAAVTDKIRRLVEASDRPVFVFAITMENHGPLRLETVTPGEAAAYFEQACAGGPSAPHEVTVYLRHLKNADRMVGALKSWMTGRARPGFLCFYGDHVPIMPEVYKTLGAHDGRTDYLVWSSRQPPGGRGRELPVEKLGLLLLRAAGLLEAPHAAPARALRAAGLRR